MQARKLVWGATWLAAACASGPAAELAPPEPTPAATPVAEVVPAADEVLTRFVDAVGGRAALEAAEGYSASARFEGPDGLGGTLNVHYRAPDRLRTVLVLDSGETLESGVFDGRVWTSNADGVEVYGPEGQEASVRRADLIGFALRYREHFPERRCVGKAAFGTAKAWVVEVESSEGQRERHFFEPRTGRLLGLTRTATTPVGIIALHAEFSDWRKVGALELPFQHRLRTSKFEQRLRFRRVLLESPPEEELTPPEEVVSPD